MNSYKSMMIWPEDKIAVREFIDTVICYFLKFIFRRIQTYASQILTGRYY